MFNISQSQNIDTHRNQHQRIHTVTIFHSIRTFAVVSLSLWCDMQDEIQGLSELKLEALHIILKFSVENYRHASLQTVMYFSILECIVVIMFFNVF